eukprot:CAMPEP_0204560256 /NCGR_PEP_ID=MMETSP0661-20131031/32512_1 /ASSEMBLY_ACC=CAM_ASM_000606 /TAXON_ID=109239 /ORGANISM="Alexandrium margalefi, Strain AMGDE01CS-322" /LENGTH=300 /DNA_ID=CAMNT_0051567567 /DNA_START=86 /DNA_END=988 /DNA_ORIENTATION=-
MDPAFPRRLRSSARASSSATTPVDELIPLPEDLPGFTPAEQLRDHLFGASFSECGPPDEFMESINEVWDDTSGDPGELDLAPDLGEVEWRGLERLGPPPAPRDRGMRRAMSVGPSEHALNMWLDNFGVPNAPQIQAPGHGTFASERASAASFATSGWQSSVASFSSEACGDRPDMIVIGRRAQPGLLSLSTMKDCPKDTTGTFLSLGSRLHEAAACTPCKFQRSLRGCRDGALCKLCHYPHESETRSQVRRAVRRSGLEKRAYFDANTARLSPETVKNTFIHVGGSSSSDGTARRRCLSN